MKYFISAVVLFGALFGTVVVPVQAATPLYIFGRANCEYCVAERTFLDNAGIPYTYYDVVPGTEASTTFDALAKKHNFTNVTPVTVIGSDVFQGFDGPTSTGAQLLSARQAEQDSPYQTIVEHLASAPNTAVIVAGAGCDQNGATCSIRNANAHLIDLPFYGLADASFFPLWQLVPILGLLSLASTRVLLLVAVVLGLLFLNPERSIFQRRLGLFLVVELVTGLYIFSQPIGSLPLALLESRIRLVLAVTLIGVTGFSWYAYRASCDDTMAKTRTVLDLVKMIFIRFAVVLTAVLVPLAVFVASNAAMQTNLQILTASSLSFFSYWWYTSVYLLCLVVPQIILVALFLLGWHRSILHHEDRVLPLSIAVSVVLLTAAVMLSLVG